ncbi:MAG: glutamate-cysteine ligase family protein [Myxococcota bacterium]|nr:glutamate-cysteine ligase family protein [Myxococcota bacterium]
MSRDILVENSPVIESLEQLIQYFMDGAKPRGEWLVGTETERFLFDARTGRPLDYSNGICPIFEGLIRDGWTIEGDPNFPMALSRARASISLEPGGQLELAGAPFKTVHETDIEAREFALQLNAIMARSEARVSTLACRPVFGVDAAEWIPRERYRRMRRYLESHGSFGHHMMVLTTTVQCNFDYASESDMVNKMRVASLVSPFAAALCANSPWTDGRWSGWRSFRNAIWFDVDNERCGILRQALDGDFSFGNYLDWVLDVPMFFVFRGGEFIDSHGKTFRMFLEDGISGLKPTIADFETHLSTLFPEVRLKKFIEVRSCDSGPIWMSSAVAAFWKGLLYSDKSIEGVDGLLSELSYDDLRLAMRLAAQDGIEGYSSGWSIKEILWELLSLSRQALVEFGCCDSDGLDESRYLEPFEGLLKSGGRGLSQQALDVFGEGPFKDELIPKLLNYYSLGNDLR